MTTTTLIPRTQITEIVARRDAALELYEKAYQKIVEADEAIAAAHEMAKSAAPMSGDGRYSYHLQETINKFYGVVNRPERDFYLRTARRITDTCVWQHIIEVTDLERLMDKQAKEELHQQMMEKEPPRRHRSQWERDEDPNPLAHPEEVAGGMPEISESNIMATLERFAMDADLIFKRGIVNAFCSLDRRFRSHDGFKIGSRMILTHAFSDMGSWNYHRDQQATILDIERVFRILNGEPPRHRYGSILQAIDNDRAGRWGARQSETTSEFFKIRIFKNGNAHIWFTRDDLVEKVNKILAEHYGEVLGDAKTEGCEADPLKDVKTTPARYFGFYPTPEAAADQMFRGARHSRGLHVLQRKTEEPLRILEPSAGTGNLARRCISSPALLDNWSGGRERHQHEYRFDNQVDCVEIQPHLAQGLVSEGIYAHVYNQDFLALSPETTGLYDIVVMNPPFDRERDIDHVMHAWKFLKPGGQLVAIMSAGTEFRETKKAIAFRTLMEKQGARWEDLPAGSFSEVGTHVNTVILRVYKDRGRA